MLEINSGINTERINFGSRAKCLKTQVFCAQVNSHQARLAFRFGAQGVNMFSFGGWFLVFSRFSFFAQAALRLHRLRTAVRMSGASEKAVPRARIRRKD